MKKTERLLAIVLALKQYGKMTACQIAELLEVNIRTIYRDMDALSQMNVPLVAVTGSNGLREHFNTKMKRSPVVELGSSSKWSYPFMNEKKIN